MSGEPEGGYEFSVREISGGIASAADIASFYFDPGGPSENATVDDATDSMDAFIISVENILTSEQYGDAWADVDDEASITVGAVGATAEQVTAIHDSAASLGVTTSIEPVEFSLAELELKADELSLSSGEDLVSTEIDSPENRLIAVFDPALASTEDEETIVTTEADPLTEQTFTTFSSPVSHVSPATIRSDGVVVTEGSLPTLTFQQGVEDEAPKKGRAEVFPPYMAGMKIWKGDGYCTAAFAVEIASGVKEGAKRGLTAGHCYEQGNMVKTGSDQDKKVGEVKVDLFDVPPGIGYGGANYAYQRFDVAVFGLIQQDSASNKLYESLDVRRRIVGSINRFPRYRKIYKSGARTGFSSGKVRRRYRLHKFAIPPGEEGGSFGFTIEFKNIVCSNNLVFDNGDSGAPVYAARRTDSSGTKVAKAAGIVSFASQPTGYCFEPIVEQLNRTNTRLYVP
jgi:hypothetical protein